MSATAAAMVASGIGSFASASLQQRAAAKAANAQSEMNREQIAYNQKLQDQLREDFRPYAEVGKNALGDMTGQRWGAATPAFDSGGNPITYRGDEAFTAESGLKGHFTLGNSKGEYRDGYAVRIDNGVERWTSIDAFTPQQQAELQKAKDLYQSTKPGWQDSGEAAQYGTGAQNALTAYDELDSSLEIDKPEKLETNRGLVDPLNYRTDVAAGMPNIHGSDPNSAGGGTGLDKVLNPADIAGYHPYQSQSAPPQFNDPMYSSNANDSYLDPKTGQPAIAALPTDVSSQFDPNDPVFKFKQQQGEEAINRSLAARGLHNSSAGINALADFNMGLIAEDADKQYSRNVGDYNRDYGRASDIYGMETDQYESVFDKEAGQRNDTINRQMEMDKNRFDAATNQGNTLYERQYGQNTDLYNRQTSQGELQYNRDYGQNADIYNRALGENELGYNRAQSNALNSYNMANQLDNQQYGRDIDLVNIGQGATGSTANAALSGANNITNAYAAQGNALSNMYTTQGQVQGQLASGFGGVPMDYLAMEKYSGKGK